MKGRKEQLEHRAKVEVGWKDEKENGGREVRGVWVERRRKNKDLQAARTHRNNRKVQIDAVRERGDYEETNRLALSGNRMEGKRREPRSRLAKMESGGV